jgi:phenylpropionate dioxygenase-like ring-hydroxylating dioxygenase large terminal subunit
VPAPSRNVLGNIDPGLRPCWHPIAMSREIGLRGQQVPARLLGEPWLVGRGRDHLPTVVHARTAAKPAAVAEQNGLVFVAPDAPVTELLDVPAADDDAFLDGWLEPRRARVGAGLMVDNFLDMAHFPFLHTRTIGVEEHTRFDDITVERHGLGMTVRSVHEFANHEDFGVAEGVRPLVQRRRVTYEHRAPFLLSLQIDHLDAGGSHCIAFYVQPEDAQLCRLYCALYRDDLGDPDSDDARRRMAAAVRYEGLILDEDLALQTRYGDLRLPLDLRTEVHVRADRPTVELRRILGDLVSAASGMT